MANSVGIAVTPLSRTGSSTIICKIGPKSSADRKFFKNQDITLRKDEGPFTLQFELQPSADASLSSLSFANDHPFSSNLNGPACPGRTEMHTDLHSPSVQGNRKVLTITANSASDERHIRYALNFVDGAGQPCACDPIIINGISPPGPPKGKGPKQA